MPSKFTLALVAILIIGTLATIRWGFLAALATLLIVVPSLAWRYDNHTGALFMIAMLLAVLIVILFLLVATLGLIGGSV